MMFKGDIVYLLPEFFIVFVLCMFLILNPVVKDTTAVSKALPFSLVFLLLLVVLCPTGDESHFFHVYRTYHLGFVMKALTVTFGIGLSFFYVEQKHTEIAMLVLTSILGMFVIISSEDLVMMFLGMELMSFCLYGLAGSRRSSDTSLEGGVKYFTLGSFSSAILMFGVCTIYGALGTTRYSDIHAYLSMSSLDPRLLSFAQVGFLFVLTGLLFKLAVPPFQAWAPDVFTGAPIIITAYFSTIPKIATVTVFFSMLSEVFVSMHPVWSTPITVVSCLAFIFGSFGALAIKSIKRLVAYGSITHMGFVLVTFPVLSVEGMSASIFYLVVYLVLNLNFFALTVLIKRRNFRRSRSIRDVRFFLAKNPLPSLLLCLSIFSLAGVPFTAGFLSKLMVIESIVSAQMWTSVYIASFTGVVTCFYYIRMVKLIVFESTRTPPPLNRYVFESTPRPLTHVIVLTSLFNFFLILHPAPLIDLCYIASLSIL